jgi:glycosyltransferase involved in cell wall biosynthesis
MWLVGYLYNTNGMGVWCWEAAHALAEAGEEVALVAAPGVVLPETTAVRILRIAPPARDESLVGKLAEEARRLALGGPRVMREAAALLGAEGAGPMVVLTNSSEVYDDTLPAPRIVVAWARDMSLPAYLGRARLLDGGTMRQRARLWLDAVGWWRRDWFAFRRASLTIGVTERLCRELADAGVDAVVIHPCTGVSASPPAARRTGAPVRLITVAESLDLPRKGVLWMLRTLAGWNAAGVELTLVGEGSQVVRAAADAVGIPVTCTGRLPRAEVERLLVEHDLFLFASMIDDWGYAVAEAMGRGLAVLAPGTSPFDEMLGDAGRLYVAGDATSFRETLSAMLPEVPRLRTASWQRACSVLSRRAFSDRLIAAADARGLRSPAPSSS